MELKRRMVAQHGMSVKDPLGTFLTMVPSVEDIDTLCQSFFSRQGFAERWLECIIDHKYGKP